MCRGLLIASAFGATFWFFAIVALWALHIGRVTMAIAFCALGALALAIFAAWMMIDVRCN